MPFLTLSYLCFFAAVKYSLPKCHQDVEPTFCPSIPMLARLDTSLHMKEKDIHMSYALMIRFSEEGSKSTEMFYGTGKFHQQAPTTRSSFLYTIVLKKKKKYTPVEPTQTNWICISESETQVSRF